MLQEHRAKREERLHPTMKPLELMQWCVSFLPAECNLIVDPFMGSGSTLLAAQRLGKQCIGIKRDERYCEIAAKTLQGNSA